MCSFVMFTCQLKQRGHEIFANIAMAKSCNGSSAARGLTLTHMANFRVQSSELHARSFLESLDPHHKSNCRRCRIRLTAYLLFAEMTVTTRSILVIWTKSMQKGPGDCLEDNHPQGCIHPAQSLGEIRQLPAGQESMQFDDHDSSFWLEELSSQLRISPYSTFLMKQHIINSSLLDFSDLPKWNPKFQTMMVQEFGLRNILNSIQEFARASAGDNHMSEVLEITPGQAGSGPGGKSKISTL